MIIPRNASTSPRCPGTAASGAAELRAKVLTADCRDTVIPYRGEAWGLLVVTSGNRAGSQPSLLPGLGTHETLPAAKVKGLPWAPLAPPCLGVPLATGFRAAPGVGPYRVGHEWGEGWGDPWGRIGWAWGGADGVSRSWLWQGGARAWVRMLSVGLGLHGGFGGCCPEWWLLCSGQRVWGFLHQGLNMKAPEDAVVEAI